MAHAARLFTALMGITMDHERWDQSHWTRLDEPAHLNSPQFPGARFVPVINCATSHCLFGQGCLDAGRLFVAEEGAVSLANTIKADQLPDLLVGKVGYADFVSAREAGQEWFELNTSEAYRLSQAGNTLLQLWALAFCLTFGTIPLPSSLPAVGDEEPVPDLRAAIDEWIRFSYEEGEEPVVEQYMRQWHTA